MEGKYLQKGGTEHHEKSAIALLYLFEPPTQVFYSNPKWEAQTSSQVFQTRLLS